MNTLHPSQLSDIAGGMSISPKLDRSKSLQEQIRFAPPGNTVSLSYVMSQHTGGVDVRYYRSLEQVEN